MTDLPRGYSFVGGTLAQQEAVATKFAMMTFPWHRLTLTTPITISFTPEAGNGTATVHGIVLNSDHTPSFVAEAAPHEMGHLLDFRHRDTLNRNLLVDALCDHTPKHGWGGSPIPWDPHSSVREFFAEMFKFVFGGGGNPSLSIHNATYPNLMLVKEEILRVTRPVFNDMANFDPEVQDAVVALFDAGITTGTGPNAFSPHTLIPRWQMALFLARLLKEFK